MKFLASDINDSGGCASPNSTSIYAPLVMQKALQYACWLKFDPLYIKSREWVLFRVWVLFYKVMASSFQQLWIVELCLNHFLAKWIILREQHLDKQPSTFVTLATWLETVPAHVKLQGIGMGVNLPVHVCGTSLNEPCTNKIQNTLDRAFYISTLGYIRDIYIVYIVLY